MAYCNWCCCSIETDNNSQLALPLALIGQILSSTPVPQLTRILTSLASSCAYHLSQSASRFYRFNWSRINKFCRVETTNTDPRQPQSVSDSISHCLNTELPSQPTWPGFSWRRRRRRRLFARRRMWTRYLTRTYCTVSVTERSFGKSFH